MKKIFWIITLSFLPFLSNASLQVSGYISVQKLGGYTYQAIVVDYTIGNTENSGSCYDTNYPDQDTIRLYWGDGTSSLLHRSNGNGDSVCNCTKINTYIGTHTYPGYGNYRMLFSCGPRVANIVNMTNSITQNMNIYNELSISPLIDTISPPIISNAPACSNGCTGSCYNFNLEAHSSIGDSLSYSLGNNLGTGYYIPANASINPVTGELSWCNPSSDGLYNFAILMVTYTRIVSGTPHQVPNDTEEVELQVNVQPNCVTGIGEINTENKEVEVYPNPNNGVFTIQLPSADNQNSEIEIYNMLGEKVYSQSNIQNSQLNINISNRPLGVYLYRIIGEQGESTGKFTIE